MVRSRSQSKATPPSVRLTTKQSSFSQKSASSSSSLTASAQPSRSKASVIELSDTGDELSKETASRTPAKVKPAHANRERKAHDHEPRKMEYQAKDGTIKRRYRPGQLVHQLLVTHLTIQSFQEFAL